MRKSVLVLGLGVVLSLTPAAAPTERAEAAAVKLITDAEARLGPYEGAMMMMRALGGPVIKVLRPDQADGQKVPVLGRPVHISLVFEPLSNSKVDMASLKVVYLKLFGIDITDRLKPYVNGETIDVPEADIPTGDHSIRVDIKDTAGRQSSQVFRFIVK
jgi:hypothetical protein